MKSVLLYLFGCIVAYNTQAQSMAINNDGSPADASALLDVKSTSKGILVPRMTKAEKSSITFPASGLLVYQTGPDSIGFHYYNGSQWAWIVSSANAVVGWNLTGNTGINPAIHFIGTTDNNPFNIRVNNQKAGSIDNTLANAFWGYQAGNGNISGTNNTAIGSRALAANTTGHSNVAIGTKALFGNTTISNTVAIGDSTLYFNTGNFNTAVGSKSLYNNVGGFQNTAHGYQSLYANTSGWGNTATGFFTLNANNIGRFNSADGYEALNSNTSGAFNTATGALSLFANTTGDGNTATGYFALSRNTTGHSNVAIGAGALFTNTTASNLVAVGDSSLFFNTGTGNTAVGSKSLYTNSIGTNNTVIGHEAGYNLTTGSNNVFIGYRAGYNEAASSNKLYIANSSVNPPIIYGDFSNNTLGIGTTSPNSTYGYAKVEIASEGVNVPTDLLIRNAANNAGYAPGMVFQHARGTLAAPVAVNDGDYLAAISSMNYSGSSYTLSATIDMFADGAITSSAVPARIQFNTMNTTGNFDTRLTIKNDGKVGIGITAPNSTLHIDGSMAVGISMGLTGGTSAAPISLASAKTYIGCSPTDNTNNFYELPNPTTCSGRIYYIRNNSSSFFVNILTAGGSIFGGSSATVAGGNTYTLNPTSAAKTVICISDGTNWMIGRLD